VEESHTFNIIIEKDHSVDNPLAQLSPSSKTAAHDISRRTHEKIKAPPIVLEDVCYTVFPGDKVKEKKLLNHLDLEFTGGKLVALMGPSGAGKTTLLNVLSGRGSGLVEGSITVNREALDPQKMRMISNIVPQIDTLIGALTPRIALKYAADMRLKGSEDFKWQRVNDTLQELGLGPYADVIIGA
jgi:ABC-type multidrug transport system ATPase subunit